MDELLSEFLTESKEHLEGIENDLLTIEEAGENIDSELVNKVFRAAHSMKGGAGFFNLTVIQTLAHKAENVLDLIRSKSLVPNPEITNILLAAFDSLRDMINDPSRCETVDITPHLAGLEGIVNGLATSTATTVTKGDSKGNADSPEGIADEEFRAACKERQYIYRIVYDLIHDLENKGKSPLEVIKSISSTGYVISSKMDVESVGLLDDPPVKKVPLDIVFRTVLEPDMIDAVADVQKERVEVLFDPKNCSSEEDRDDAENEEPKEEPAPPSERQKSDASKVKGQKDKSKDVDTAKEKKSPAAAMANETLRVNVEVLEMLMNQAGELVLSRNQLIDSMNRNDPHAVKAAAQRIDLVTGELQEVIMQTRLQPVGNVFNKFPRVVRDTSIKMGKEIDFVIEGKDVELDKTLIEGLSDPLTHMIRNAVDHGLETPDQREKAGKDRMGKLLLKASHQAGQVVIEISDDGKGIDVERIANKALDKGLVKPEQIKVMTDKDKAALVFLAGLSTAEKVTDISGRGVGMDVVKTNLDRLGGKVEIETVLGEGTRFVIKLPLTLAIIPSLIVSVEEERFAVPQVNVAELLRIRAADVKRRIEVVGDAEVLVLRGNMLPLVRFSDVIGMVTTYIDPVTGRREVDRRSRIADRRSPQHSLESVGGKDMGSAGDQNNKRQNDDRRYCASGDLNVVIASSGLMQYGILVDELHNSEEIVVKPLGRHLKGLPEYAGATIMGDGKVALIIDAAGLAIKANLTAVAASTRAKELKLKLQEQATQENLSLLLFNNSPSERCAMPLELVKRVERIEYNQIEKTAGKRSMQYREETLPLVTIADCAQVAVVPEDSDNLAVIVTSVNNRDVGLVALMPVEVIETPVRLNSETIRHKGISGSMIIKDTTVLMVDIYEIVETAWPDWVKDAPKVKNGAGSTLLLAEDSDFFRGQMCKHLSEAGYNVIEAVDGLDGWEKLRKHPNEIDAVVTDIEMPRMNGFELCTKIREVSSMASLPVIAVTSLAGDDDKAMGLKVGITDYQIKLDRDKLIEALQTVIKKEMVSK